MPFDALDPAGRFAHPLADISWLLFALSTGVLILVLVALAAAIFGGEGVRKIVAANRMVVIGGFFFPVIVLSGLLVYGLTLTNTVSERPAATDLRVRVVGEMWWWRIIYLDEEGAPLFETANELRIPVGQTVAIELQSGDVIHSFWVPQLGPKRDMIPGRTNVLRLHADREGVFRGQCAEFCGASHALMAKQVVALPADEFDAWASAQAGDQSARAGDAGAEVFAESGCGACHTVRGTPANGRVGPDLTHVGGRLTIGAGILPNEAGTRRAFISDPDRLKPGIRMPGYRQLPSEELDSLNEWLGELK